MVARRSATTESPARPSRSLHLATTRRAATGTPTLGRSAGEERRKRARAGPPRRSEGARAGYLKSVYWGASIAFTEATVQTIAKAVSAGVDASLDLADVGKTLPNNRQHPSGEQPCMKSSCRHAGEHCSRTSESAAVFDRFSGT